MDTNGRMVLLWNQSALMTNLKSLESVDFPRDIVIFGIAFLAWIIVFRFKKAISLVTKSILRLIKLIGRLFVRLGHTYLKVLHPISGSDIVFFGIFLMGIRDVLTVIYPFDTVRQFEIYFWFTIFTSWFLLSGLLLYLIRRFSSSKKVS